MLNKPQARRNSLRVCYCAPRWRPPQLAVRTPKPLDVRMHDHLSCTGNAFSALVQLQSFRVRSLSGAAWPVYALLVMLTDNVADEGSCSSADHGCAASANRAAAQSSLLRAAHSGTTGRKVEVHRDQPSLQRVAISCSLARVASF